MKEQKSCSSSHSSSVIAEFMFDRWILKALCQDANHNGLIRDQLLSQNSFLKSNLTLIRDCLASIVASEQEFLLAKNFLPKMLQKVCDQKRAQAE